MAYLQRLLDTAAPVHADPVSLAPVVRSASPVFEQDQLLALTDREAQPAGAIGEAPAGARIGPAAPHRPAFPRHDPPAPFGQAATPAPMPMPPTMTAEPPAASTTPAASTAEVRALPTRDDAATATAPPNVVAAFSSIAPPPAWNERDPSDAPAHRTDRPASVLIPAEPIASPTLPADVPEMPEMPEAPQAPKPFPRHAALPDDPPPRDVAPGDTVRADAAPSPRDARQAPVELTPRPRPDRHPTEAEAAPQPPPKSAAPTITIGHVTVEIVDDRPAAPASTRPLTAAAASVIGPLGQARTARRLIALRHR